MLSIGFVALGADVEDKLEKLAAALQTNEVLDEAGALLLNRIRTRFLDEKAPSGQKWTPSKAGQRRRSAGGTGTLFHTGRLFHSIQLASEGENGRSISTDVPYAPFLVERWPFLGFNDEDGRLVEKLLFKRAEEALR